MESANAVNNNGVGIRICTMLGLALLASGLLCHVLAAQAIGGTHLAYRDHLAGFFGLTLLSGALIAALGWRFWKGRTDISILILGVVQAVIGVMVYLARFSVHG